MYKQNILFLLKKKIDRIKRFSLHFYTAFDHYNALITMSNEFIESRYHANHIISF